VPEGNGVFVVGVNPATPIGPDDLAPNEYRALIGDYAAFMRHYQAARARAGKRKLKSNTRVGLEALSQWLQSVTGVFPLETNVVAYPTKDEAELDKVARNIVAQGERVFLEVLQTFTPRAMIFHGKSSLTRALPILQQAGLLLERAVDLHLTIRELEASSPLVLGIWKNGGAVTIAACRHLKIYGQHGKTFARFRDQIQSYLM
jgi:hypothetical protein